MMSTSLSLAATMAVYIAAVRPPQRSGPSTGNSTLHAATPDR